MVLSSAGRNQADNWARIHLALSKSKPQRPYIMRLTTLILLCQEHVGKTYGYRRMHIWLKKQGICRNPKTVLRIMQKYGLLSQIRRRRKYRKMGKRQISLRKNTSNIRALSLNYPPLRDLVSLELKLNFRSAKKNP